MSRRSTRGALQTLDDCLSWFELAERRTPTPALSTIEYVRSLEATAANSYFNAMRGLALRWVLADRHHEIPPYWRAIGPRVSPLSSQRDARHAADPYNATTNYVYECLVSQTRVALIGYGFDPSAGLMHTDRPKLPDYPALAFDLMELARPEVDDALLSFVRDTTFTLGDFVYQRDGECRMHPQMARAVIAATRLPQRRINSYAKWLREIVMQEVNVDQTHRLATARSRKQKRS